MKAVGMGDNVVDRYVNKRIMFPGGNAVNFAVYAKQCGADAAYLGVIADDKEGRLVYDSLKELGVELPCAPVSGLATERCDVLLEDGDRIFQDCSYGEGEYRTLTLSAEHLDYLKGFDLIHCGCYGSMEEEMKKLDGFSAVRTYDFSSEAEFRTDEYLEKICPYIDIALFSAEEMEMEQVGKLREKAIALGTKLVLITKGTKGQTLWDGKQEYTGVVKLVEPVDTMGAGDSFFTAFVTALIKEGYCREEPATEEMISRAFEFAADFSAKTCLTEGAFGFGTAY